MAARPPGCPGKHIILSWFRQRDNLSTRAKSCTGATDSILSWQLNSGWYEIHTNEGQFVRGKAHLGFTGPHLGLVLLLWNGTPLPGVFLTIPPSLWLF